MMPIRGDELPFPDGVQRAGLARPDADPRKYGFHGTLKAPMALAPGKTEAELMAACATFAAHARPIPVIRPVVDVDQRLHRRRSGRAVDALEQLAADCVREFDPFRPALTRGRSRAPKSRKTERAAARLSRPLGLSLRDGGIPFPHDADGAAGRGAARTDFGDAAGAVRSSERGRSRSIASRCFGRMTPRLASASLASGGFRDSDRSAFSRDTQTARLGR